jgi:hypothetical protein
MKAIIVAIAFILFSSFVQSRDYLKSRHKRLSNDDLDNLGIALLKKIVKLESRRARHTNIDLDDDDVETLNFFKNVGNWIRNHVPIVKNIADTVDAAKRGDKGEAAASFFGVAGIKHAVENKDAKAGVLEGLGFAANFIPGAGKGIAMAGEAAAKAAAKGIAKKAATKVAAKAEKTSKVVNKVGSAVQKVNRVANAAQQIQQGQLPNVGGMRMPNNRNNKPQQNNPPKNQPKVAPQQRQVPKTQPAPKKKK